MVKYKEAHAIVGTGTNETGTLPFEKIELKDS